MAEAYSEVPNELIKAPNGVHYAYRDTSGGDGIVPRHGDDLGAREPQYDAVCTWGCWWPMATAIR
jgi:hypothetical protein